MWRERRTRDLERTSEGWLRFCLARLAEFLPFSILCSSLGRVGSTLSFYSFFRLLLILRSHTHPTSTSTSTSASTSTLLLRSATWWWSSRARRRTSAHVSEPRFPNPESRILIASRTRSHLGRSFGKLLPRSIVWFFSPRRQFTLALFRSFFTGWTVRHTCLSRATAGRGGEGRGEERMEKGWQRLPGLPQSPRQTRH